MKFTCLLPSVHGYEEPEFSPGSVGSEAFLIPPATIIDRARLIELLMLCFFSLRKAQTMKKTSEPEILESFTGCNPSLTNASFSVSIQPFRAAAFLTFLLLR